MAWTSQDQLNDRPIRVRIDEKYSGWAHAYTYGNVPAADLDDDCTWLSIDNASCEPEALEDLCCECGRPVGEVSAFHWLLMDGGDVSCGQCVEVVADEPENVLGEPLIRHWVSPCGDFDLWMWATRRTDHRGQTYLRYRLSDSTFADPEWTPDQEIKNASVVFEGSDFAGSPLSADDSDATVAALLGFLSPRPGDTDAEYFDEYSEAQLDWAQDRGELLALYAFELEEPNR